MPSQTGSQTAARWPRRLMAVAAWMVLAALVVVTLAPISVRPSFLSANVERFGAFALVALLFGLAYRRSLVRMMLMLIAAVVVLEAGQVLTATRHAGLIDVAAKLSGIGVGALVAVLLNSMEAWRRWFDPA